MATKVAKKLQKKSSKYECNCCNYITGNKYNFNKHLITTKHKFMSDGNAETTKVAKKLQEDIDNKNLYICDCGHTYKHRGSLFKHKKKCNYKLSNFDISENILEKEGNINYKDMFYSLINDNNDFKNTLLKQHNQLLELLPKMGNIVNNVNTTNNNQKFNINVFLNEECKDALNMSDFIKSIEVSLEQLDFTKNNGLINGLSKTIMDNMSKLSVYERPLHCTDVKREILYIKEDDKWEKDSDKSKIKQAIKKASDKNYNALKNWKNENPDFEKSEDKQTYFAHTISTIGKPIQNIDEKVIKKICSNTYLKESL
jgi:hypothetical protein